MAPGSSATATSHITLRLLATASIVTIGAMQFGFHLAELNAPQDIVTCGPAKTTRPANPPYDCIPMSSKDVGLVNGIYSIGGFLSASLAGSVADRIGRRRVAFGNCVFFLLGSLIIASSYSVFILCVGRFIAGLGAGSAIVVTPLYLNEISPHEIRGFLGSMNQVSVNVGILFAQVLGLFLSTKTAWRKILFSGAVFAVINALLLPFCVESPKWLALKGMTSEACASLRSLRGRTDVDEEVSKWKGHDGDDLSSSPPISSSATGDEENSSLLPESSPVEVEPTAATTYNEEDIFDRRNKQVSTLEFCVSAKFRNVFIAVVGIMISQQICGVNSIIFYGVSILATTLPKYSAVVNVLISALNLGVTAAISPFVDRFGRRPLLLGSILGMTLSSAVLSRAMIDDIPVLASVAATAFVVSFAAGLGPIPFLIISEMSPHSASGVAQSVGTTANWVTTFAIGFLFPILKAQLDSYVFFIFTFSGAAAFVFVYKCIPETKGKSPSEVWAH